MPSINFWCNRMQSTKMTLAYSPCPNDTYLCSAIASGKVAIPGLEFDIHLHDIEDLNQYALEQRYDISKVSCYTWLRIREHYRLLQTGAAIGYECGPLLLASKPLDIHALGDCRIAFPGALTTAWLLFQLCGLSIGMPFFIPYHEIVPRVASGEFDCGVIIHESRFTYKTAGLHQLIDLGKWWREETGLPVPLGCFVMRRGFSQDQVQAFEELMLCSIAEADSRDIASDEYIRGHAREQDAGILDRHIRLYVNDYSLDLGREGQAAIEALAERAGRMGILT